MTPIPDARLETLVHRARAEFREMPGLRLTFWQMRRLWALDRPTCEALVERLLQARVLTRTTSGDFVRFGAREGVPPSMRNAARRNERAAFHPAVQAEGAADRSGERSGPGNGRKWPSV